MIITSTVIACLALYYKRSQSSAASSTATTGTKADEASGSHRLLKWMQWTRIPKLVFLCAACGVFLVLVRNVTVVFRSRLQVSYSDLKLLITDEDRLSFIDQSGQTTKLETKDDMAYLIERMQAPNGTFVYYTNGNRKDILKLKNWSECTRIYVLTSDTSEIKTNEPTVAATCQVFHSRFQEKSMNLYNVSNQDGDPLKSKNASFGFIQLIDNRTRNSSELHDQIHNLIGMLSHGGLLFELEAGKEPSKQASDQTPETRIQQVQRIAVNRNLVFRQFKLDSSSSSGAWLIRNKSV